MVGNMILHALGVHDWHNYAESSDHMISVDHRVCRIAACQRHEVWLGTRWQETRTGAPGI
jgi:hypothetical protein